MKNDNEVLKWLRKTDIPLSRISKKTGLSRKSLYNWQQGHAPTTKSLIKLTEYYQSRLSVNNSKIKLNTDGTMNAQYIIDLQEKRIKDLEMQASKHLIEDQLWDNVDCDYTTEVQLYWEKPLVLGRKITKISDWKPMIEATGYSEKELDTFFQVGKGFPTREHPVDAIIHKESLVKLRSITDSMKHLFTVLKSMVGDYHLPITLWYINKDQSLLPASVFCKVEWSTMLVKNKIKLMD